MPLFVKYAIYGFFLGNMHFAMAGQVCPHEHISSSFHIVCELERVNGHSLIIYINKGVFR